MEKKKLLDITLIGADCVDADRLKLAMDICRKDLEFGDAKLLTSLPTSDIKDVIKINPINSAEEYSRFIIYELDRYINTSHALIVQHDGFILAPEKWDNEYLKYDYIGAPWLVADWAIKNFDFPEELKGQFVVGNGGFSLRSKKLISLSATLAKEGKLPRYHNEDIAICIYYRQLLEDNGIKFAPVELAKKFSFEAFDDNDKVWDGQFGFHGLSWTDISKWTKLHPEYKIDNPAFTMTLNA